MKKLTLQTAILCLILGAASLHATQLFWSGNGTVQGGAGTWDTTAAHWGTSTAGPFTTVWNNANSDDATVDNGTGAGGSIAMPATINMNGTLTVNASCGTCPAYSFDGAGTTIFGSASAISVPTGVTRSFNSPYAGIITKIGAGTLAFNNSLGNVTKFIFKQGIASFASFNRFGSGADAADFLTFDGGSVLVNTTTTWTVGKSITLTANGGTLNKVSSTITMTLDKAIHGTAGGKLTLQPAGSGGITIISSTANDWSGGLDIGGTTTVQCGAAGVIPGTCLVTTLASGANLQLNGFNQTVKSISGSAGSFVLGVNQLTLNNPAGESFSSAITGVGGGKIVKNGSGSITLSPSTSTYDGGFILNSGKVGFGVNAAFGAGTLTINNSPGNVTIGASSTSGRGPVNPVVLNGNLTIDDSFTSPTPGTITWASAASWTISGGNRTLTVNTAAGGYLVTIAGAIGEDVASRALTKAGNGILSLTSANTFSGGVNFSAGQIRIADPNALGTGKLTLSGAGVRLSGNNSSSRTLSIPVDLANDAILGEATPGSGNLTFQTGAFTIVGSTRQITVDTVTATISSVIGDGGGNLGITKAGSGQLTLSGNNTFTGPVTVTAGTLRITGTNLYSGSTTLSGGSISINDAMNPLGSGVGPLNFAGGNLIVTADRGTSADNFTNPLNLSANTELQSASTSGTRNLTFGGAWTTPSGNLTLHENGTGAGPVTFNVRFTNAFTFTRPITFVADNAGHSVNLDVWNRADLGDQSYAGVISGPGSIKRSSTTPNTGGKVSFTAQNTYAGGTSLNDGEIGLGSDCAGAADAPTAGPLGSGAVTLGNDGGKLSASGASRNLFNHVLFTAGGTHLTFLGANDLQLSGNVDLGAQSVTFTNNNTGGCNVSGVISNGSLTEAGPGKLTLSAANTYAGATTVSGGTLLVNGSINGAGVTVQSGGTLGGSGGIGDVVTVQAGGTLAPGGSIGTLTLTNSPVLQGTTLAEINSSATPNSDKLVVLAGLAYGGALTVNNIGPAPSGGETFDLFDATSFSGAFTATNLPALAAGLNWWTDKLYVDGSIVVNRAPVAQNKTYARSKGASLKIPKADLLSDATDPDGISGDSASYDSLQSTGTQGATVTEDATFVYYEPANDNADTLQYRVKDTRRGFSAAKNIQINVVGASGQAQSLMVSGNTATVSFAGIPGLGYEIQRSTNLVDWTTLVTTNAPANGLFNYTDNFSDLGVPPDPVPASAYYRLREP